MSKMQVKVTFDMAKVQKQVKTCGRASTWAGLDYLLTESRKQVPLDQGTLLMSGYVDVNDDGTQGVIGYDTPYAVRWHEEHANFQRGRKNKYLEDPANDPSVQANMLKLMGTPFEQKWG